MRLSVKQLGLFALIFLLLISVAANAYLFEVVEQLSAQNGKLASKLDNVVATNKAMAMTIDQMQEEKVRAQNIVDSLAKVRAERTNKTIQTVTVIKEVLKHEKCAVMLIPDADERVYYN